MLDKMKNVGNGMVFKIDFKKAYDSVEWNFLWFVMSKMGFRDRWSEWFKRCVSCARVSIFLNGSAGKEFKMERGLKQGCLLSPLLSNLVAETLPILLGQFEDINMVEGHAN